LKARLSPVIQSNDAGTALCIFTGHRVSTRPMPGMPAGGGAPSADLHHRRHPTVKAVGFVPTVRLRKQPFLFVSAPGASGSRDLCDSAAASLSGRRRHGKCRIRSGRRRPSRMFILLHKWS
jgi:hypothetical protein